MPTHEETDRFQRDLKPLTVEQRSRFRVTVQEFVEDLRRQQSDPGALLRPGLRVKPVQGTSDVWEISWAGDGRATFSYGEPLNPGDVHIIWRRVGTHEIFRDP